MQIYRISKLEIELTPFPERIIEKILYNLGINQPTVGKEIIQKTLNDIKISLVANKDLKIFAVIFYVDEMLEGVAFEKNELDKAMSYVEKVLKNYPEITRKTVLEHLERLRLT